MVERSYSFWGVDGSNPTGAHKFFLLKSSSFCLSATFDVKGESLRTKVGRSPRTSPVGRPFLRPEHRAILFLVTNHSTFEANSDPIFPDIRFWDHLYLRANYLIYLTVLRPFHFLFVHLLIALLPPPTLKNRINGRRVNSIICAILTSSADALLRANRVRTRVNIFEPTTPLTSRSFTAKTMFALILVKKQIFKRSINFLDLNFKPKLKFIKQIKLFDRISNGQTIKQYYSASIDFSVTDSQGLVSCYFW